MKKKKKSNEYASQLNTTLASNANIQIQQPIIEVLTNSNNNSKR